MTNGLVNGSTGIESQFGPLSPAFLVNLSYCLTFFFFYSQRLLVSTNLLMFLLTLGICSGLRLILLFLTGKSFLFVAIVVVIFMFVIELPGAALSQGAAFQIEVEMLSLVHLEAEAAVATGQVLMSHQTGMLHLLHQLVAVTQPLANLSDMASGETANTLSEVEALAWRKSFSVTPLTLLNNTQASTLRNMMISPLRLQALVCLSPFFHSPALLWIHFCWKTSALPCTPLLLLFKNIQSLLLLAEGI